MATKTQFATIREAYNYFFFETDTMKTDQAKWLIDNHKRGVITIEEILKDVKQETN